jgi:hypothetical protein
MLSVHAAIFDDVRTKQHVQHLGPVNNFRSQQRKLHMMWTARACKKPSPPLDNAKRHDGVYIASCPLAGFSSLPANLGHTFANTLPNHVMVLVVLESSSWECCAFDFLPLKPASPLAALRLLAGYSVQGDPPQHFLWIQASILSENVHPFPSEALIAGRIGT